MAVVWKDRYSTGDKNIDDQHRKLFEFLKSLEDNLEFHNLEVVTNALFFLRNYADIHFTYEEMCMARHKCPAAEKNKSAHKQFVDMVAEFEQSHSKGATRDLLMQMRNGLESWMLDHICKIDIQLKPCLQAAKEF